jgi:hypothetical protein
MTISTTNSPSAIDAVVSALRDGGADLTSPVKQGHAGLIYNSADDSFTQTVAAPTAGTDAQETLDTGVDLQASANQIGADHNKLVARLNEATFDPITGKSTYAVTGEARDLLTRQIAQSQVSAEYSFGRLNAIAHQRAQSGQSVDLAVQTMIQGADGKVTSLQEAAARMSYVDSAPPGQRVAFGQEYDRLMQEARTRSITDAVTAARRR